MPSVTVGTTSVTIVNQNSARKTITFTNRSVGGQVITLDNSDPLGLQTTNGGYVIAPGAAIAFLLDWDGPDILGPWSSVADGAGGLLFYKETSRGK
jgi:hypothetical protein